MIKQTNDEPITVELQLDDSVATLKALVAEQTSVPAQAQRLLHRARVLDEGHTLRHYNILTGHSVRLVKDPQAMARKSHLHQVIQPVNIPEPEPEPEPEPQSEPQLQPQPEPEPEPQDEVAPDAVRPIRTRTC